MDSVNWDRCIFWTPGSVVEHRSANPKVWGSISHGDSEFFLCPTLVKRRKNIFLNSLPSSKLTISLLFLPKIVALLRCWYNLAQGFFQMLQAKLRNLTEHVNTVLIKLLQHRLVIDYNWNFTGESVQRIKKVIFLWLISCRHSFWGRFLSY